MLFINTWSEKKKKRQEALCYYWKQIQNKENSMNFGLQDLEVNPIPANLIQQICMSMYQVTGIWPGPRLSVLRKIESQPAARSCIVRRANRRQINSCRWGKATIGMCAGISQRETIDSLCQGCNRKSPSADQVRDGFWRNSELVMVCLGNYKPKDFVVIYKMRMNGGRQPWKGMGSMPGMTLNDIWTCKCKMPRHWKRYWSIFISHLILCAHMQVL